MAYDFESLEIFAEFFELQDRNCEKYLEIITSVHCRGNGIHVDIAPKLEGVALEGNLVRIDLRTQTGSPGNAFHGIGKAVGDKHSGGGDYLCVFKGINYAGRDFRMKISTYEHLVFFHFLRLGRTGFEAYELPLKYLKAEISRSKPPAYAEKILALWLRPAHTGKFKLFSARTHANAKPVFTGLKVQGKLFITKLLCSGLNPAEKLGNLLVIEFCAHPKNH